MSFKHAINELLNYYDHIPMGDYDVIDENGADTRINKRNWCFNIFHLMHGFNQSDTEHAIKNIKILLSEKNLSEDIEKKLLENLLKEIMAIEASLSKIKEIIKMNKFETIKKRIFFFEEQFYDFDRFSRRQNRFDNMISVMKIYRRYNNLYKVTKLDMELEFENENDIFNEIQEQIYIDIRKDIGSIRYEL